MLADVLVAHHPRADNPVSDHSGITLVLGCGLRAPAMTLSLSQATRSRSASPACPSRRNVVGHVALRRGGACPPRPASSTPHSIAGIGFLDTAAIYGVDTPGGFGSAETLLGEVLRAEQGPARAHHAAANQGRYRAAQCLTTRSAAHLARKRRCFARAIGRRDDRPVHGPPPRSARAPRRSRRALWMPL